jgi:hypothetical protein
MKKIIIILFVVSSTILAQGTAGSEAKYEYRKLIGMQTAGILEKGYVGVSSHILPNGVVDAGIEVGVFPNVSFGISYGGSNVIGTGSPIGYPLPGINFKFRVVDETDVYPAFTLGFDSQGMGDYLEEFERYEYKSEGLFVAASKNFEFLGYLSIHGNFNYSLERDDNDKDLNLKVGAEKTIGKMISVIAEYDFAINDNGSYSFGSGRGYLNMGARVSLGNGFSFGVDLRNMLDNNKLKAGVADRGIFFEYISPIF